MNKFLLFSRIKQSKFVLEEHIDRNIRLLFDRISVF